MTKIESECPTEEFQLGEAAGKCWGNGNYLCKECKHFRADFKVGGQEFIDLIHLQQSFQVSTLKQ